MTAFATTERRHAGEEHNNGDDFLGSGLRALAHKFDGVHLFAGHEGAPVPAKQQPRDPQRKELEDLQARLITSEAHTRQREGKLEDVRATAEAELDDAHIVADASVLESELEHEHAPLEEEHRRTTELEDCLVFLELEVASSPR